MGKYLNIGNAGFTSAVKGIYIDKTEGEIDSKFRIAVGTDIFC